jgi:tetratricopeptide (TPR) repeat protein
MNTMVAAMENRVSHARALCDRRSWKELLAVAQQWQAETPEDAKPWFYQGVALSVMGRFAEAETAYRNTLRLDPSEAKAWNNLGAILFEALKQQAEGIQCLMQSLKLDPGNKLGWSNLASMHGQLGRHQQALECAERALALDPEMIEAHLHRGRAAQLLGRPEILQATCATLARLPAEKFKRAH